MPPKPAPPGYSQAQSCQRVASRRAAPTESEGEGRGESRAPLRTVGGCSRQRETGGGSGAQGAQRRGSKIGTQDDNEWGGQGSVRRVVRGATALAGAGGRGVLLVQTGHFRSGSCCQSNLGGGRTWSAGCLARGLVVLLPRAGARYVARASTAGSAWAVIQGCCSTCSSGMRSLGFFTSSCAGAGGREGAQGGVQGEAHASGRAWLVAFSAGEWWAPLGMLPLGRHGLPPSWPPSPASPAGSGPWRRRSGQGRAGT